MLKRVSAGEVIDVTDHGHPIARLIPLRRSPLEQLTLEGRATEASVDLLDLMAELHLPTAGEQPMSPSTALADLRTEDR